MIDPKFKEWACSFSGCDGGDLKSVIWLCGIEWGFSIDQGQTAETFELRKQQDYAEGLPAQIAQSACQPTDYHYFEPDRWRFPYLRNIAKLLGAIKKLDIYKFEEIRKSSMSWSIFHMNLYRIAFSNESDQLWEKYRLSEVTALESKQMYRTWCLVQRFPWIAGQLKAYHPKLIIGTGVGYLTDFIVCCGGSGIVDDIHREQITADESKPEASTRTLYWTKVSERTTLAVIPFMTSRFGLNSNALIERC